MKKGYRKKKLPIGHITLGLGVALIATTWYWSDLRAFYSDTAQAAAVFLGFSQEADSAVIR